MDLEVGYRFEPNFFGNESETFNIRAILGTLSENSTTTAAGTTQDLAGSQPRPEYSGIVTANYGIGPWGFMLQSSYYHTVMNNFTWLEGRDIDDNLIASHTTFSFATSYSGDMDMARSVQRHQSVRS